VPTNVPGYYQVSSPATGYHHYVVQGMQPAVHMDGAATYGSGNQNETVEQPFATRNMEPTPRHTGNRNRRSAAYRRDRSMVRLLVEDRVIRDELRTVDDPYYRRILLRADKKIREMNAAMLGHTEVFELRGDAVEPDTNVRCDTCSICLDPISLCPTPPPIEASDAQSTVEVRKLQCGHAFHRECVDVWLVEHAPSCPLCRKPLNSPGEPTSMRHAR